MIKNMQLKGRIYSQWLYKKTKKHKKVLFLWQGLIIVKQEKLKLQGYNSGGSQFFIMTKRIIVHFRWFYAAFGKVKAGMDVVRK